MFREPSEVIEDLKVMMREAGYTSFSVTEENGITKLEVEQTISDGNGQCFWQVLKELGINCMSEHRKTAIISLPPFGVKLPVGEYDLLSVQTKPEPKELIEEAKDATVDCERQR